MRYKYIIIESEEKSVNKLQVFFENEIDFLCVGVSGCYNTSLNIILKHKPDIIFIDVDSISKESNTTAFNFINELYQYLPELPHIIALSSSTKHAYLSIKNNFFDYILKPIDSFDLRKSISRLSKMPNASTNKLCIKSHKDYRFIDLDEILFLKADNTATDFFMSDGSMVSAYKTLKFFKAILPDNFIRIHNSYVVNQDHISRIHFGKSKCSLKYKSQEIPFSKSYKENVITLEKNLSKSALLSLN